jgi:mannose/fructose-specific phosphotransferase system component IIA|uniref:PTS EIIA type-4 domain-containing protein n=1 Tax=candidate division WOR-3 bacterium TaxID=2052148 RepID=A0A7C4TIA3_UNCW3
MIKGIIVGHGNFAHALFDTIERILGPQEAVDIISNENLSCESLTEILKKSISADDYEKIIFVDLPGGSCAISCLNLLKTDNRIKILCGVNMPMLIEFFLLREKYKLDELVPILLKKARENIMLLGGKSENNR